MWKLKHFSAKKSGIRITPPPIFSLSIDQIYILSCGPSMYNISMVFYDEERVYERVMEVITEQPRTKNRGCIFFWLQPGPLKNLYNIPLKN